LAKRTRKKERVSQLSLYLIFIYSLKENAADIRHRSWQLYPAYSIADSSVGCIATAKDEGDTELVHY
jgi:hypothetical protein